MLVIRLSRVGRKNQVSYRIVVAEKTAPIKGKFVEVIGTYNPSEGDKLSFQKDRVEHWVSKGAQPSPAVAMLLRSKGMSLMDPFVKKLLNRPKKKVVVPKEEPKAAEAPKVEEVPAVDAPAVEEAAVEEVVVEEAPEVESTPEEAPAA